MKNAKTMLNEIKTLLGVETNEVKLANMKLENGTVLEAEAFEAGNEVFIVTEDEKVALPVGEYALEDGNILVVSEEGLIAEIKSVEGEEPVEEEAPSEELAEEVQAEYATKEELAEVKSMIEEIKAMLEPKEEMSEETSEEVKEELSEEVKEEKVEEVIKEELSAPAAEPLTHSPEAKEEKSAKFKFANSRTQSTRDRVYARIAKINNK